MGKTYGSISEILVPTIFEPYVIERSTVLTDFGQSDIVETGPQYDALITEGGKLVNMPAWKASTVSGQARQIISASGAFSVNNIDTATDVARICNDGNAWSVTALAKYFTGDDPMAAIQELVAQYWAEIDQNIIIQSITGVIGAASFASNLLSIASESTAGITSSTILTGTTFIDALAKLGDAAGKLTAIAIHSATQAALKKLDLIDYIPDSEGKAVIESFQGRRVITVDSMPRRNGTTSGTNTVLTSVLFGPGEVGQGNQNLSGAPLQGGFGTEGVEFARVPLNHDSVLIMRRRYIKHIRGMAWQDASVASDAGPTDAELATQTNWVMKWQQKNVRLVAIVHNN